MADQFFFGLPVEFKDVNTGEMVKCGFDQVAEPDAWGMVRFHPHAPVELMYPLAPQYVHELEGIAQDAVLGVLAKTTNPGLAAGLETIVDKLSDGSNRLEYPPGQRGNPLPVSEVVRQEYTRLFPQDDETNIYRMQVYTWRLSDVIRVCKRLLLDPDAIFRTQTSSPEPSGFLNFAGDSSYGDDIRLREPNCEPLLSDGLFVGEGKYRVFRKAPGHHPRDRPATYHNNYSEIAGAPDPLHDFGIKHWRNDAGQAAQFRYACCWQAPGSPGCLITYPSQKASQTTRNVQGGLERVAGLPVLYQWFGGFAPTAQTAKFRGAAFLDREYADALHEKITASLTDALVQKIATRAQLSASETRVVAQIAGWMHQYNAPLLGCALNMPPEEITTGTVDAYLDRVVKDRTKVTVTKTKTVPKTATPPKPLPKEVQRMIASARLHGFDVKSFEELRAAIEQGRALTSEQIAQYRERIVRGVPLYKAVDLNDQWLIDAKRQWFSIGDFEDVLNVLRFLEDEAGKKRVEAALLRSDDDRKQVLIDVKRNKDFTVLFDTKPEKDVRAYVKQKYAGIMDPPLTWLYVIKSVREDRKRSSLDVLDEDTAMENIKALFFKTVFDPGAQIARQRAIYEAYQRKAPLRELPARIEEFRKASGGVESQQLLSKIRDDFGVQKVQHEKMTLADLPNRPDVWEKTTYFTDWKGAVYDYMRACLKYSEISMYKNLYPELGDVGIGVFSGRAVQTRLRLLEVRKNALEKQARQSNLDSLRESAADPDINKKAFFGLLNDMKLPSAFDTLLKELRLRYVGGMGANIINITRLYPVQVLSTGFPASMEEFDKFQKMAKTDPSTRDIAFEKGQVTLFYPKTEKWENIMRFFLEFLVKSLQEYYVNEAPLNTVAERIKELQQETTRILKTIT